MSNQDGNVSCNECGGICKGHPDDGKKRARKEGDMSLIEIIKKTVDVLKEQPANGYEEKYARDCSVLLAEIKRLTTELNEVREAFKTLLRIIVNFTAEHSEVISGHQGEG